MSKHIAQILFQWLKLNLYIIKVSKGAKTRNRYNQVPHLEDAVI